MAVIFALLSPIALCGPSSALEIEDDTGTVIQLDRPAERIIALYGAFNEILGALGLEDRLVGRTKTDRLPRSIVSKPSIGTHMRPNVEMVVALKPDLIVQGGGRRDAMIPVNQLRSQGLPVAVFTPSSFEDLFSVIHKLGMLTGASDQAAALTERMKKRLKAVNELVKRAESTPSVFFEVRYPNLLAAGRASIVNDVIEAAGGRNCVTRDKKLVRLNIEALIKWNPDYYVVQEGAMNRSPTNPAERPHFRVLDAIGNNRVLFVDEQIFSRPGPRSVDAVEQLSRFIHPKLWEKSE